MFYDRDIVVFCASISCSRHGAILLYETVNLWNIAFSKVPSEWHHNERVLKLLAPSIDIVIIIIAYVTEQQKILRDNWN